MKEYGDLVRPIEEGTGSGWVTLALRQLQRKHFA